MLLADAPLTLREFVTHEELPLASIFREMFLFLRGREDVVLFGAHAVNAYCEPSRMTQDVDVMSSRGRDLAEEIRAHLAAQFHIAVRVREVADGLGFRIYQVRKPKNRHLVDVRQVPALPASRQVEGLAVLDPTELTAMKAISAADRSAREKGLSDRLDLARLLRTFPALRAEEGPLTDRLRTLGASERTLDFWREVARAPIDAEADESEGDETE
ncbi:MAG: hypothetical protein ACHREM_24460 [Polyangiales bacterium]